MTDRDGRALATKMAELARQVAVPSTVNEVLSSVTATALEIISGVDCAGVLMIVAGGKVESHAGTSQLPQELTGCKASSVKDRAYRPRSPATLLDELAALDPSQRCEVATELRRVSATFAGVPDGRHTAHTLGLLAHLLDQTDRRRPVPQGCLRNTRHGEDLWHL